MTWNISLLRAWAFIPDVGHWELSKADLQIPPSPAAEKQKKGIPRARPCSLRELSDNPFLAFFGFDDSRVPRSFLAYGNSTSISVFFFTLLPLYVFVYLCSAWLLQGYLYWFRAHSDDSGWLILRMLNCIFIDLICGDID